MDVQACVQGFLEDVRARGLSDQTWVRYRDDLKELGGWLERDEVHTIEGVTVQHLRGFFSGLQTRENAHCGGKRLSPFTIEGRYRTVKTFFRWCVREGMIESNSMERVGKMRLPQNLVSRLDGEAVVKVLRELKRTKSPRRNVAMVMLMVDSGLRRGEVLGLKVEDVNLKTGLVLVNGKGAKQREVPLGKASRKMLAAWLRERPLTESERVFVGGDGSPLEADAVMSLLNRIRQRVGFKRLYAHLLRHTFAKMFLLLSHDAKALQQILGHSRVSTTLDLYVHYETSDLIKVYARASPVDVLMARRKNGKR